jgi:hypothetical protein
MKFSLLVLSRERPGFLKNWFDSIRKTVTNIENIEVILRMDKDDPTLNKCKIQVDKFISFGGEVKLIIGQRPYGTHGRQKLDPATGFFTLGDMWNECWRESTGDILQLCGDDTRYDSPGWDKAVRNVFLEYPDRIAFVWGPDGRNNRGTHPWIHRKWTEIIGYFCPPNQVYGNDSWLEELGHRLKRHRYLPNVKMSHKYEGGVAQDKTRVGLRLMQQYKRSHNMPRYIKRGAERDADYQKLKKYIDSFGNGPQESSNEGLPENMRRYNERLNK